MEWPENPTVLVSTVKSAAQSPAMAGLSPRDRTLPEERDCVADDAVAANRSLRAGICLITALLQGFSIKIPAFKRFRLRKAAAS